MNHVIVIGGGIAGLSAAARLSEAAEVTLLEAEAQLGHHASGRSAAAFLEDYGNRVVRALNRASRPELEGRAGDPSVLSPRGMILVARQSERADFEEEVRTFSLERISPAEAAERVPILDTEHIAHAATRADIFDLDTDLLLQGYRKAALAAGARIETGARVTAIARKGNRWEVMTGDRLFRADALVNAAGAWADEVAAMAGLPPLGLQPFRRSIAVLPPPEGLAVDAWPFVLAAGELWYAKPQGGRLLVSPSEEDPVPPHDAWPDDMVLAEGLHRFEQMTSWQVTRVAHAWAGLRTFAPDRCLVIGPDPLEPSFLWSAGQGGYGFQTAPAASRLLADLAFGRAPELEPEVVAALSPRRFR